MTSSSELDLPIKKYKISPLSCKRKFPGPAGLSPETFSEEVDLSLISNKELMGLKENAILISSQYSSEVLRQPCYQKLIMDFGLNIANSPLNNITLKAVSKAAIKKGWKNVRIPFLGLLVSSISERQEATVKLMDVTYEVNAVMHKDVWNILNKKLKVNCALALAEVPIIASCTTHPPFTLFISKKTVLSVYIELEDNQIEVVTMNNPSNVDLKKNCQDWLMLIGVHNSANVVSNHKSTHVNSHKPRGKTLNCQEVLKDRDSNEIFMDVNNSLENFDTSMSTPFEISDSSLLNNINKKAKYEASKSENLKLKKISNLEIYRNQELLNNFITENQNTCQQEKRNEKNEQEIKNKEELSPSEKLMVQEVLSGINFEDFDL